MLVNLILKGKTDDLFERISCCLLSDFLFFIFFIMIAALCFCRFSDILYTQVKPNTPNSLLLKTGRSSSVIKGAEPIWSKVGLLFQRLITVNNSRVID